MEKIARAMGYSGNMQGFQDYLAQDPMRQQQMQGYQQKAMQMAKGGVVKMQTGGIMQAPGAVRQTELGARGGGPYDRGPAINTGTVAQGYDPTTMDNLIKQSGMPPIQPITKPVENTGTVAPHAPNITSGEYRGIPFDPNAMRIQEASKSLAPEQLGQRQPISMGQIVPEFIPDTSKVKPEDQLQAEWKRLQESARKARAEGFMGQVVMPGEGSYEDWKQLNQYELMRNPNFTPSTGQSLVSPDYSGMTYELALARQQQLDVKSPAEAAAIQAALARGPQQQQATTPAAQTQQTNIGESTVQRMYQPGLPAGGVTQAAVTPSEAGQYVQPGAGTVTGAVAVPTAMAATQQAVAPQEQQANIMEAATAAPAVDAAMNATQAAQGTVDPRAQVTAAQQTASSVGDLTAAQGNATLIDNPVQRQIQQGELISGAAADAATAAQFTEQIQAAQATPSTQATVQGQLASLTANFDAGNPPAWAAGAMRNATAQMAARGLGASSLAGQAIVQATLEAALPIAQADAATVAQFEAQNLSNRQQRAMLAAQQRAQFMGQEFDQAFQARVQNASRISDIANMNFTAEQQVQLENSRAANTMNLNNLSNSQAMVMAEASALAQMDAANLNNRQQAAVQNAQTFLQTDMANLSNQQQTELFKAQQRTQAMFTDQAATNAARQFNASSQNQVDQFFANLATQTSQFNATQSNAQAQFNAGQANTVNRFNAEINNQRDQFNAQNQLVIAQSNAQWRRQIATADTAAVNRANELNAAAVLDISKQAYDNLWNYYADTMEWAWTSAENDKDRLTQMALGKLSAETNKSIQQLKTDAEESGAIGGFFADILTSQVGGSLLGKLF
jgi:hypothetical protein